MPAITLPDGSQRVFDNPVSVADVAADIGAGLAKATLAGVVNGEVVDASYYERRSPVWRLLPIAPMRRWILFVTLRPTCWLWR